MTEKELERLYGKKISTVNDSSNKNAISRANRQTKKGNIVNSKSKSNKGVSKKSSNNNMNRPNRRYKTLKIKKIFFMILAICMIVLSVIYYNECQKVSIYIDAGHGGHDTGAISLDDTRYEKDDNLNISLLIKEQLEKMIEEQELNLKVVLTRDTDEFLTLAERCRRANRRDAIMFVSLHRNSLDTSNAKGVEVWINNYENESEIKLASMILDELSKVAISENRGIKYGTTQDSDKNYYVNEFTNMKSVIVELGFISNEYDNLLFDTHINEYATAISNAIINNILDGLEESDDVSDDNVIMQ